MMSFADYQQGTAMGNARANAAINEWEDHANGLKQKLRNARIDAEDSAKKQLFTQAQLKGQAAIVQALKTELARVCPNSPLLREDGIRQNIAGGAMAQFLKQHGYDYDPRTQQVRKVGL